MICAECNTEIPPQKAVVLNGRPLHVDPCFGAGLRALTFKPSDLAVQLADNMAPMDAYRAGQRTVATIVASRRKAKKKT